MAQSKLILDYVHDHEASRPEQVYLIQPVGQGRTIDYTWRDVMDQARRMAAHIKSLDLEPGSRIAILSKNCAHFFIAELAIWMAGGTTVAIFPTESAETIHYILDHSEARLLFVGKLDNWEQQKSAIPPELPCIALPLAPEAATGCLRWDRIMQETGPLQGRPQRAPLDIAMLLYTSGSTGQPKGVMQSFESITAVAEGDVRWCREGLGAGGDIRFVSYLPLAHAYERSCIECASLVGGDIQVFFVESLDTFLQDLQRARPTIFQSVPRLWLKFQQGVFAKLPSQKLDRLLRLPIVGYLVRRKILKGLGLDHVRMAVSGSAPIPADLIAWYRKLGLNLLEGYAMTEDFAYSHLSTLEINEPGYVGTARPGVQVRLSEDGEVLIKSTGQLAGYFKRPDLDAQSFTEDRFFRTGDLGEIREDGLLRITGRKGELFKTGKGKYVAPAPIENLLNAHPLVEMSMVSGVGQTAAYALVVLAQAVRPRQGEAAFRAQAERQLAQLLLEVNLSVAHYERLQMLVVAREPWSIENGCLTPTMKLRRACIEKIFEPHVRDWYAGTEPVRWA